MPGPIPPERRAEWTALLAELWAACEAAGVDCPTVGAGDDTPGSQPGAPRRYVCGARLPDGRELGFEGPEPFWPVQACARALRAEVPASQRTAPPALPEPRPPADLVARVAAAVDRQTADGYRKGQIDMPDLRALLAEAQANAARYAATMAALSDAAPERALLARVAALETEAARISRPWRICPECRGMHDYKPCNRAGFHCPLPPNHCGVEADECPLCPTCGGNRTVPQP